MSADTELDVWRRQWQAAAAAPVDLRRKVQRQSRFMRFMLLVEILVTVVIGGGATAWAARSPEPDVVVLALVVWFLFAATWTFAVVSRRGLWSPGSEDTAAFLDLSIRRCRASVKAATFGTVLYFCEIVFCLAWVYQYRARRQAVPLVDFLGSGTVLMAGLGSLVFLACVVWYRRRKRAELRYLVDLQREMGAGLDVS